MHLHLVEQNSALPEIREDPFKREYLARLRPIDRLNLAKVVTALESNMPSGTRVLAVGGTTELPYDDPDNHKDIDLKVFGNEEYVPILGHLVYGVLSQMDEFRVQKSLPGEMGGKFLYSLRNLLPCSLEMGGVVVTPTTNSGKPIEIIIPTMTFEEHYARSKLPSVVLH